MSALTNISNYLSLPSEVISITIDISVEGNSMDCLFLKKKKDGIHVEEDFEFNTNSFQKHPILLTITGKGVLYKTIDKPLVKVRSKDVLPSSKEQDFYWYKTGGSKQAVFGIIRKEMIINLIKEFELPAENIIDVILGPLAFNKLQGIELDIPNQIQGLSLQINNQLIVGIQKTDTPNQQTFLGENIPKQSHLGYLSGIEHLYNPSNSSDGNYANNFENLKSKAVFKKIVVVCLSVLLIVFMGNAVAFKVISEKNNQTKVSAQQQKQLVKKVDLLGIEINSKKALQKKLNLHSPPTYSFYLDEIGKTVPKEIQLTQLTINPLAKALKPNQVVTFNNAQLHIEGVAKNTIDINVWKRNLSKLKWVKRLELTDLKRSKTNRNRFLIQIDF